MFNHDLFVTINGYTYRLLIGHYLPPKSKSKMAAISQKKFFKHIILNETNWIMIEFSPKFVRKGSIDNNQALVR